MRYSKLIVLGLLLSSGAVLAVAVQSLIPDRKESAEASLNYISDNLAIVTAQIGALELERDRHQQEFKRVRCELWALKKADNEVTQPESDSLCIDHLGKEGE